MIGTCNYVILSGLGVVLLMPCQGRFMWPFAVAGFGLRYLRMSCSDIFGHPLRKPFRVAFNRVEILELHKDWCANLKVLARVPTKCANIAMLIPGCTLDSIGRGCGA
jgi:hypothetical protein